MDRRDRIKSPVSINGRKLTLPKGKKIILWVIVNLEVWDSDLPQLIEASLKPGIVKHRLKNDKEWINI